MSQLDIKYGPLNGNPNSSSSSSSSSDEFVQPGFDSSGRRIVHSYEKVADTAANYYNRAPVRPPLMTNTQMYGPYLKGQQPFYDDNVVVSAPRSKAPRKPRDPQKEAQNRAVMERRKALSQQLLAQAFAAEKQNGGKLTPHVMGAIRKQVSQQVQTEIPHPDPNYFAKRQKQAAATERNKNYFRGQAAAELGITDPVLQKEASKHIKRIKKSANILAAAGIQGSTSSIAAMASRLTANPKAAKVVKEYDSKGQVISQRVVTVQDRKNNRDPYFLKEALRKRAIRNQQNAMIRGSR